jgi:hypothetical protein
VSLPPSLTNYRSDPCSLGTTYQANESLLTSKLNSQWEQRIRTVTSSRPAPMSSRCYVPTRELPTATIFARIHTAPQQSGCPFTRFIHNHHSITDFMAVQGTPGSASVPTNQQRRRPASTMSSPSHHSLRPVRARQDLHPCRRTNNVDVQLPPCRHHLTRVYGQSGHARICIRADEPATSTSSFHHVVIHLSKVYGLSGHARTCIRADEPATSTSSFHHVVTTSPEFTACQGTPGTQSVQTNQQRRRPASTMSSPSHHSLRPVRARKDLHPCRRTNVDVHFRCCINHDCRVYCIMHCLPRGPDGLGSDDWSDPASGSGDGGSGTARARRRHRTGDRSTFAARGLLASEPGTGADDASGGSSDNIDSASRSEGVQTACGTRHCSCSPPMRWNSCCRCVPKRAAPELPAADAMPMRLLL